MGKPYGGPGWPGQPDPPPLPPGPPPGRGPQQAQYGGPGQAPYGAPQPQHSQAGAPGPPGWQPLQRVRRPLTFSDVLVWSVLLLAAAGALYVFTAAVAGLATTSPGGFDTNHWENFRSEFLGLDQNPVVAGFILVPLMVVLIRQVFPAEYAAAAARLRAGLWINLGAATAASAGALLSATFLFGGTELSGWAVAGRTLWALVGCAVGAGITFQLTRIVPR